MKILSVLKTKMKLAFLQYFKNTERNVFTSIMGIYSSHSNFQCIGGKSTFCEKNVKFDLLGSFHRIWNLNY